MSVILGIGPPCDHDPSAALLVDGQLVAAAEEERFSRHKHAVHELPVAAARHCLTAAGLRPEDVDVVAFGWDPATYDRAKWRQAAALLPASLRAARKTLSKAGKINRLKRQIVTDTMRQVGIDPQRTRVRYVEHHLAHAASAYLCSGFPEAAVMSIDGSGEFVSLLCADGQAGALRKRFEMYTPHSLGLFYSTVTEYLGFAANDGEYKVMGMAPYGDPQRADLSCMIRATRDGFRASNEYVWVVEEKRHRPDRMYARRMVERFGPPRSGDALSEPYIHIAAAAQRMLEDLTLGVMERQLGDGLRRHGTLCLAGGCALNVTMNRKILQHPLVKRLYVQPAANDAGTALGAAAFVAAEQGETVAPMTSAYWGPSFSNDEIRHAIDAAGVTATPCDNIADTAAELLARGEIVGWFQGRMEFGPRALGNRSILGHPALPGTSNRLNAQIKFREGWRPFCPSILEEHAPTILGSTHPSPFMSLSFLITESWRTRIPEVVHVDGSARPQTVNRATNPRFAALLEAFERRTGLPVVINTSMNRRGEPMVCTPQDALAMLAGSGLDHLCLGDYLVSKRTADGATSAGAVKRATTTMEAA